MKTWKDFGWDKGLDFEEWNRKLLHLIEKYKQMVLIKKDTRAVAPLAYTLVLLVQLRNALRISEAVEAVCKWAETSLRKLKLCARKSSRERPVVIPREVADLKWVADLLQQEVEESGLDRVKTRICVWTRRNLGINTHALRYAAITYLIRKKKLLPQEVAKITGHKKLDMLIHYYEMKKAEDVLDEMNL